MVRLSLRNNLENTDSKGNKSIIKKNIFTHKWVDPQDILSVEELCNRRGDVYKKKCLVTLSNGLGEVVAEHTADYILKIKRAGEVKYKRIQGYIRYD